MLVSFLRSLFVLLIVAHSVYAYECQETLGVQIGALDCYKALGNLFTPILRRINQNGVLMHRLFRLHDPNDLNRMPKGTTFGTCSIAIDIASTIGDAAGATWGALHEDMYRLIRGCVVDGSKGQGGTSTTAYGFALTVVNPHMVDVANTCMAMQGPRRMDVIQCVQGIVAKGPHPLPGTSTDAANIPHPPTGTLTEASNIPHPPLDTSAPGPPTLNEDDLDLVALYFPEIGPDSTGPGVFDAASAIGSSRAGAFPEGGTGTGAGPDAGTGPSADAGPSGPNPLLGLFGGGSFRALPPAPHASLDSRQQVYVGDSYTQEDVAGVWIATHSGWQPGKRRRSWKYTGLWYLVLGLGEPTPFPAGDVPAWHGGEVRIRTGKHTSDRIAEAWAAEHGSWTPLEGAMMPKDSWVTNGGWVLLRGLP
ncbi:hypothetical protein MMC34_005395 [Xylographa carneopallida]|nr:hypothetical protein [Xylographa carneopallida]